MGTLIKRLIDQGTEFVPITLSEAVVVNTDNLPGISSLGITTLDKILVSILGISGSNASDIILLNNIINLINLQLSSKLDKLTPGIGITISDDGVISTTFTNGTLYKIFTTLPTASAEYENLICLIPSSETSGNIFTEYLCLKGHDYYYWEMIGTISTDVDLTGYVSELIFNSTINNINSQLLEKITAEVLANVNYEIPNNIYG